ncbi:hypothetical protein FB451DRAFT_1191706 [Mycena latifolia]|nr:hypothetical protein FB451DRAFT_1191706 [Mycena latifolia]
MLQVVALILSLIAYSQFVRPAAALANDSSSHLPVFDAFPECGSPEHSLTHSHISVLAVGVLSLIFIASPLTLRHAIDPREVEKEEAGSIIHPLLGRVNPPSVSFGLDLGGNNEVLFYNPMYHASVGYDEPSYKGLAFREKVAHMAAGLTVYGRPFDGQLQLKPSRILYRTEEFPRAVQFKEGTRSATIISCKPKVAHTHETSGWGERKPEKSTCLRKVMALPSNGWDTRGH